MKIVSIEPTPSPHSMKINVNDELPAGENFNYKHDDDLVNAPDYVKRLFEIEGVKNLYRVVDFIALARNPKVPWESILPEVRKVLGSEDDEETLIIKAVPQPQDAYGEIKVFIQLFRDIPMQVKLEDGSEEKRFGLPERFTNAILAASPSSPNVILDRKWVEQHTRYGSMEEIGNDVVEEIVASYDQARLDTLVELAFKTRDSMEVNEAKKESQISIEELNNPDWKVRFAALDRLIPSYEDLPLLEKALDDEKASIRRLATAYLGMIEEPEVLPYLYKALNDKAINVRRTAGDCISDLGFKEAMPKMIETLSDSSRIVRWRAAMFLYEVGDESAIPALEAAIDDPEFEVRMQIKMALARIKGGEDAKGSIWHQMTQATKGS
ncbi:conserved virulence factor C family protein [Oceanobacillus chungangensis]|uniref:Virulence factor n=1 Tax=Oceanobacillus chungangensis TaxID=1229152 RepID=A0A3D8PYX3_9BACI|nr:conserved virulence factor C family protein [Oceanobacillus chungangensis]RDW21224.1 virulence factor [Oceanobacillus chungangensis]